MNGTLHESGTLPKVAGLYDEAISWFVRVFTPPDERIQAIVKLARSPYVDSSQVAVLRTEIAYNAHHLGRFLAEVRDPAWLDALFEHGLIHPPRVDEPWPIASLIGGNGGIAAENTVALLRRLRESAAGGEPDAALSSVLATFRPVLEYSARDWLDRCHGDLFGGELGPVTFEATLKYPRPTTWLYENHRARIAAAALDGVPNAVALPLIGYLSELDRFTIPSILGSYRSDVEVLRRTAEEITSLVQDAELDAPALALALSFWDGMLDGAGSTVPKAALTGAGRWVFVEAVPLDDLMPRLDRTVQHTGGEIDFATAVADRCRDAQPSEAGLRILRLMQGHGEPWERDHAGRVGLQALAAASGHTLGAEFNGLRDRLIELGFHDATTIDPEAT